MSRQFTETDQGCLRSVDGNVVPIVSGNAVDGAWEDLRSHMSQVAEDPCLWLDRTWMEKRARLLRRFDRLLLLQDESGR